MRTGEWLCTVSGCCVILTILTCASAAAQPAGPDPVRALDIASLEGGLPPLETVPVASVPSISAAELAADALQTRRGTGPLRVASVVRTNISAFRAQGVTDESQVGDGDPQLTWRLRFVAPGATSIGVGFTRYHMPPGGRLFVFTPDYQEVLGPFTDEYNADHGQLWVPRLPGAELVVEISVPADVLADVQVEIGAVERGFLDTDTNESVLSCQTDVVCSEANRYGDAIRSVAYIEVLGWRCSGALINNTREDRKPYFLTAYHCGGTGDADQTTWWSRDKVASLKVFWRHHSDRCGQRLRTPRTQNWQPGARFVAGNLDNDFTLLELTLPVLASSTYRQHFAGWSRDPNRYRVVAGIHHPNGEAKSIAFDQHWPYGLNVYPRWVWNEEERKYVWAPGRAWCSSGANCDGLLVYWDKGGTTGGSSGSPLFNGRQRIIGQLWGNSKNPTCGDASLSLGNTNYSIYGWVKGSWEGGGTSGTRLRDWLDPNGTGDVSIGGIDAERGLPNLVVRPMQVSDSTLYARQAFTLFATVHNEGGGTAQATRLYWWRQPPGGSWARLSGSAYVASLSPSQSSDERDTQVAPSLVGTHWYTACVTALAMESNRNDNCSSRAVDVTVRARVSGSPNLRVIRPSISDSTPAVGQRFTMRTDVFNAGTAGSASTRLRYWRRPAGGTWEGLGSVSVGTISAGRYSQVASTLTAPSRSGRYDYSACVDSIPGESNTRDNCLESPLTVTVGGGNCTTNWGTLSARRSVDGSWTGSCQSRHYSETRYARYYSFTIRSRTSVTIDLTSSSVDTWLALYSGGGFGSTRIEADDDDGDARNARITRTLEAGTYTIEATTYSTERTGNFTLTVAPGTAVPQGCTNRLGTLSSRTVVRNGAWTGQCPSVHYDGKSARYYSFTLPRTTTVTLDLTSSTVDTWLALYRGSGTGSSRITYDDDSGTGLNARIVRELSAGTYTIEATTYLSRAPGSFRLTVAPRNCQLFDCLVGVDGPPLEGIGGDPETTKGEAIQQPVKEIGGGPESDQR